MTDTAHRLAESIKQGRLYAAQEDLPTRDFADVDAALDILAAVAERRGVELPEGVRP